MTMTEAPLSYTIKVSDPNGFDEMFTIRGDNAADYFSKITALKKWLVANGYKPNAGPRRSPQPANAPAPQANAPACPYHGAMKPSTKAPGTFYCTSKMADGSYCKTKTDKAGNIATGQPQPMTQAQAVTYAAQPPAANGAAPVAPAFFDDAPPPDFNSYYGAENN